MKCKEHMNIGNTKIKGSGEKYLPHLDQKVSVAIARSKKERSM